MTKRAIIFIDGSNLFHASRKFRQGFKVDFVKLRQALAQELDLIRAYYYGSFDPSDMGQQKFHDWLSSNGFEVVIKPLRNRDGKKVEKGADVGLVTDLISLGHRNAYDTAIVVSGDADFVKAIKEVKWLGKKVFVASFDAHCAADMRKCSDGYISLDKISKDIERMVY